MAKFHSEGTSGRDGSFNKMLTATKKAAHRNNVVLLEACANGKLNYIKTSIDAGADVHYVTDDGDTPLLKCASLPTVEGEKCLKYLVKRGADINFQDKYGRTTLSYVAERGNAAMVDVLITKCDADPTIEDVKGNTPLMYAVSSGSVEIVATIVGYFLVVDFPIDKRNFVGNTALILAAKMGRYDCATMLVEVGNASMNLRDVNTFRSALDWIRIMCPESAEDFRLLDPVLQRKRECSLRRRRIGAGEGPRYRILTDFFPDGKMPSCWRSSSKTISQEPRKHQINRTICIVSDMDADSSAPPAPDPAPEPQQQQHPEVEMDEALDSIFSTLHDHTPSVLASSLAPITSTATAAILTSSGGDYSSSSSVPRSMFDIPSVMDARPGIMHAESGGRFMDSRCDSVMSVLSAPSPTMPRFDPEPADCSPLASSPPITRPLRGPRTDQRRKSIDNSSLLSRPQVSSPVVKGKPSRVRTSSTSKVPSSSSSSSSKGSPGGEKGRRTTSDPIATRAAPAATSSALARVPVPEKKLRAGVA